MVKKGFILVELLIVMAIISILATLIVGGFRSSQARGRDAQRKSDLKQVANALELFFSDYGKYPPASGTLTDGKTTYMRTLSKDPVSAQNYVYRVSTNQSQFQLFAYLENPEDKNCIGGDCANPGITVTCGGTYVCNFGMTSTNTAPTDTLP